MSLALVDAPLATPTLDAMAAQPLGADGGTLVEGVYSPGNSPGLGTFTNVTLQSSATYFVELDGLIRGLEYDAVDIRDNFIIRGRLVVALIDGFVVGVGQRFLIADIGGVRDGTFRGLPEGATVGTFGGVPLQITYTAGDGNDIEVFAVPEPAVLLVAWIGLVAVLGASARERARSLEGP